MKKNVIKINKLMQPVYVIVMLQQQIVSNLLALTDHVHMMKNNVLYKMVVHKINHKNALQVCVLIQILHHVLLHNAHHLLQLNV